ncbi:MAG: hypothetical protein LBD60_00310 [Puniceicoccales bacterium]|jgi:hypothetical protein|nr:hypothetical protein [Puniceicoccales bacterium]
MKTNTKIRLLLAALGGSVFSYSDARASDSMEYPSSKETRLEAFSFGEFGPDYPNPYRGYTPAFITHCADSTARMGRRKPTITGTLSSLDEKSLLSTGQRERRLALIMHNGIQDQLHETLPVFAAITLNGFKQALREGGVNECSLEELFNFSFVDHETFQHIVRGLHSPREAVAIYGYATDAITGKDGLVNQIKHKIMREIRQVIQVLIMGNIPDEVIEQLEAYCDYLLEEIIPALKLAMFEYLQGDEVAEVATGCCGWCKRLTKENKKNLTKGILHTLSGALGLFFGRCVEQGLDEIAQGICGIIDAQNDS